MLHDIGKVDVPYEIINKPGKLNDEEFEIMKRHPTSGDEMLDELSHFVDIRNHIRHHHERMDGSGYPDRISRNDFSLGAKILAVADAFDAMTTDRPYRKALSHEIAIEELQRTRDSQFDAEVVDCFACLDLPQDGFGKEPSQDKETELVRTLTSQTVKTENLEDIQQGLSFKREVDEGDFLQAIFENTPCGYVLFDSSGKTLFASDYYLNYQSLDAEHIIGTYPERDLVVRTLEARETLYEMREEMIEGLPRIYDLFSIPVLNEEEGVEYVIACTIDRTEETLLERSFERDLIKVIKLVRSLIAKRLGEDASKEQIERLEKRLAMLAHNWGSLGDKSA